MKARTRLILTLVLVLVASAALALEPGRHLGLGLEKVPPLGAMAVSQPAERPRGAFSLALPETLDPTPPPEAGRTPGFPSRLLADFPALAVAPLEWEGNDWRKLGLSVLAVGAVSLVDEPIAHWIDAHPSSGARRLANRIRPLGQEGGLAVVGGAWLLGRLTDQSELEAVGADGMEAVVIAAGVITPLLKLAVGRLRPRQADRPEWEGARGKSFPSGEATEAFAIASVVASHSDRTWVRATAWGLAGLIGLQRMELDAHYASDVLAGALIGAAVGRWVVHRNRPEGESGPRISMAPIAGSHGYGVAMNVSF